MLTHRISLALCMVAVAAAQSATANEIELETLETGLRFDIAVGGLKITMADKRGCKAR